MREKRRLRVLLKVTNLDSNLDFIIYNLGEVSSLFQAWVSSTVK